jgi:parallel beta-helix repeat protein
MDGTTWEGRKGVIVMIEMRKARNILLGLLLAALAAVLMTFAAGAQTVTLQVSPGENISKAFNKVSKESRSWPGMTTIVIPPGNYVVDQLRVWGNTTVSMQGVTLTNQDGAHSMLRLGAKEADWDEYNGGAGRSGYSPDFSDISFIGGTWDNNGFATSIMQMGHAQNLSFDGVTFQNVNTAHHLEFGGCQNIRIINCTFTGYSGNFGDAYNGEAIQFEVLSGTAGKHFSGYHSVTDETPCKNVEISGCTFDTLKRGVGSHTAIANSYFSGFRIHDNTFRNITGYAVSMLNYTDSSVYHNTITACGSGIMCAASDRSHANFYESRLTSNTRPAPMNLNCRIYDNVLSIDAGANGSNYNNLNYGIYVFGEKLKRKTGTMPAGDWRVSGVTVSGNKVTMNVAGGGIWLRGTKGVTVSGNTVTCSLQSKGKVSFGSGIRTEFSENDKIVGNKVQNQKSGPGKKAVGILINEKTQGVRIERNRIENTGSDGIRVTGGKNVTLRKNTVKGCGGSGIKASKSQLKTDSGNKISK